MFYFLFEVVFLFNLQLFECTLFTNSSSLLPVAEAIGHSSSDPSHETCGDASCAVLASSAASVITLLQTTIKVPMIRSTAKPSAFSKRPISQPSVKPTKERIELRPLPTKSTLRSTPSPSFRPSRSPSLSTTIAPSRRPSFHPKTQNMNLSPTSAPSSFAPDSATDFSAASIPSITVRKEIRDMSTEELDRYFNALWEYKNVGRRDNRTYFRNYNELVAQHALATANSTVRN